jgi:hypothetical protein
MESEEVSILLGRLRRATPGPPRPDAGAEPETPSLPTGPTADDLATVLALVVVSDHDVRMLVERTGFTPELATAVVEELGRRGVIRDVGGGFHQAAQTTCPGPCVRGGHELRGQEIVITPPSFGWWCAPCWDSEHAGRPGASAPADVEA